MRKSKFIQKQGIMPANWFTTAGSFIIGCSANRNEKSFILDFSAFNSRELGLYQSDLLPGKYRGTKSKSFSPHSNSWMLAMLSLQCSFSLVE